MHKELVFRFEGYQGAADTSTSTIVTQRTSIPWVVMSREVGLVHTHTQHTQQGTVSPIFTNRIPRKPGGVCRELTSFCLLSNIANSQECGTLGSKQ